MCHLLFDHQRRQTASQQKMQHMQESLPYELFVQVVQNKQRQQLPALQEFVSLRLKRLDTNNIVQIHSAICLRTVKWSMVILNVEHKIIHIYSCGIVIGRDRIMVLMRIDPLTKTHFR
jgi:hypothetical protein